MEAGPSTARAVIAAQTELAVDEAVDPVGQVGEELRLLRLRQPSVLHGLREVGFGIGDERGLQPVD